MKMRMLILQWTMIEKGLLLDWILAIHHFDVVHKSNNADWSDAVNESRCGDGIRTQSREFLDLFLA